MTPKINALQESGCDVASAWSDNKFRPLLRGLFTDLAHRLSDAVHHCEHHQCHWYSSSTNGSADHGEDRILDQLH